MIKDDNMEDELENSRKRTLKTKQISTKIPKTPSRPFVSPMMRRCELEDKSEQSQRAKRIRCEDNSKEGKTCLFQEERMQTNSSATASEDTPTRQLADVKSKELQLILKEKQETLRKLNLVRMYRKKNNLQNLQRLINKWRNVSQEGATSLLNSITEGEKPSMSHLLQELQINQELIHYSTENETFW